jgi:hypothetical protein
MAGTYGANVEKLLRTYQESILDRQYQLGRAADVATELYVSACVLRRMDWLVGHAAHSNSNGAPGEKHNVMKDLAIGRYYLQTAERRMNANLAALWSNDDDATTATANLVLAD